MEATVAGIGLSRGILERAWGLGTAQMHTGLRRRLRTLFPVQGGGGFPGPGQKTRLPVYSLRRRFRAPRWGSACEETQLIPSSSARKENRERCGGHPFVGRVSPRRRAGLEDSRLRPRRSRNRVIRLCGGQQAARQRGLQGSHSRCRSPVLRTADSSDSTSSTQRSRVQSPSTSSRPSES